jgi:3-oxoacyl-[acyl-carrier-protein] synthase II
MKRVVITGIGAVTPLARTFRESWLCIKSGESGITELNLTSRYSRNRKIKWRAAGRILYPIITPFFSEKEQNYLDPFISYAVIAAMEAATAAGLLTANSRPPAVGGIIIGSSRGGISTVERELVKICSPAQEESRQINKRRVSPFLMPTSTISAAAAYTGSKLGITGYTLGISNACASGSNAIGEAFRMIRNGSAALMLAGGTDAPICGLCIEGYGEAKALSTSDPEFASRPFDMKRDGFVLAEGACVLVLEDMDTAIARGALVYGEIIGYGNACSPAHLTMPSVRGETLAISKSIRDAGIAPENVDLINAHATSTRAGDMTEAESLNEIFGNRSVPVSALKSMTGHMLAASGAFEAACAVMSIKEGVVAPTINTRDIDPKCKINLITEATHRPVDVAVSNSFGFGGVNSVLTFRRFVPE